MAHYLYEGVSIFDDIIRFTILLSFISFQANRSTMRIATRTHGGTGIVSLLLIGRIEVYSYMRSRTCQLVT